MKEKIMRIIGFNVIGFIEVSFLLILFFGFFSGILIWSIILVTKIFNMLIVVSAIILLILFKFNLGPWAHETDVNNTKTNNKDVNPFRKIIDRHLHKLTIVIFLIIVFSNLIYSFFMGVPIWSIIVVTKIFNMLIVVSAIILSILVKFNLGPWAHEIDVNNTKTNYKDLNPFRKIVDKRLHKLTIVIFLIIVFSNLIYSFFMGVPIWSIIVVTKIFNMLIVVSAIILSILFKSNLVLPWILGTDVNLNPFSIIIDRRLHKLILVIFLIIIFSILIYSFFSGMFIWGIIAIIHILISIALLYGIIWFWGYLQEKKS